MTLRHFYSQGAAADLAFSCSSASTLYSIGQFDRRLGITDARSRKRVEAVDTGHQLSCLAARNDGVWLAVGTQGGKLLIYDTRSLHTPLCSASTTQSAAVKCINFQPCERTRRVATDESAVSGKHSTLAEPPAPQVPASPWLAAASPMPHAGISPLGNGLSSFTPLQSAGMSGSISTMRSGRHTPRYSQNMRQLQCLPSMCLPGLTAWNES
jgi:hypothetical protein